MFKKPKIKNPFLLIILIVFMAVSCKKDDEKEVKKIAFAGKVIDLKNQPIADAKILINQEFIVSTDQEGRFELEADSAQQYQIGANKEGYGAISKVFTAENNDIKFRLFKATVKSFNPREEIRLTDTNSTDRPGPTLSNASFNSDFNKIPLVYKDGKLVDFGFSPEMQSAFEYVQSRKQAGPGISIAIPANALVRNGSSPSGNVNVSVATIDLFTAGDMPGDMTVVDRNGRREGFMVSYGAGSIEVYDEEGSYQLKKDQSAEIAIPVDSSAFVLKGEIPESIPLFYYNEDTGFWTEDGIAKLDRERNAFVGMLKHFSTFNMDFKTTTPSCAQIRNNSATSLPAYKVEAIVPFESNIIHRERTIEDPSTSSTTWPVGDGSACLENSNGTSVHMLYNLPENTEICLIFYEPGSPDVAINVAVTTTGPTYGTTLPTCPDVACPGGCADNCTTTVCGGFGSCTFVPFSKITAPIILAAKDLGSGDIEFKWVYNATAGAYTYELIEVDEFSNPIGGVLCSVTNTISDDPFEPKTCTISGVATGQHFYKVRIMSGTDESQTYDINI